MRLALALALACFFTLTGVCHAQTPSQVNESQFSSDARSAYAEGKLEFAQGRYETAIVHFERAYTLSEAPGLLFNMAQAHRLLGEAHCREAFALYRSYLAAQPEAENRREVEERIAALEACASRPAPLPVVTEASPAPLLPPAPKPLPPLARPSLLGPALSAALGASVLASGVVLYARAQSEYRDAERECPCYPGTFTKWERLTTLGYVAMGVGGGALVAGTSWWLFVRPPSAGHATLGLGHRF